MSAQEQSAKVQISDDVLHCTAGGGDHLHTGAGQVHPVTLLSAAEKGRDAPQSETNPLLLQEGGHAQASLKPETQSLQQ